MISESEFAKWKKKRASTYVVYLFLFFLVGLEYGGVAATLWIYVSTVLNTDNPKFYYGLINSGFFIPSLFFPPIVSRIADKTRRVKFCVLIILNLSIVGSFIYTIHYHPLFCFFGRLLNGFGVALYPLIISEVARSYKKTDLTQRLQALSGSRMCGYAFGPCISMFFIKTNFKIGPIHVTYANIIGPITFLLATVLLLVTTCFMHDLSREYDLKADTMDNLEKENYKASSTASTINTVKKIFQTTDTSFILVMTLFYGIVDQAMFRTLPILIIDDLHLRYALLNGSLVVYAVVSAILIFFLIYHKISNNGVYCTGIASLLSIMMTSLLLLLLYYRVGNVITWYVLIALTVCLLSICMLSDQAFSVLICAKLTHSCNQGFMEGIRIFTIQSGRIVGVLGVGLYYSHMNICYAVVNLVTLLLLICLLLRKQTLSNPAPVV